MKTSNLWIAAATAAGLVSLSGQAQAQYYYPGPQRGYYAEPPVYVPPRIARKQAEQSRRFVEKYGYVPPVPQYGRRAPQYGYQNLYREPQYGYGGGYREPQYGRPNVGGNVQRQYGVAPRQPQYGGRRAQGYDSSGQPLYYDPKVGR